MVNLPRWSGRSRRPRQGFTLVELLVVGAIIVVLVGLTIPVTRMVKESVYIAQCASNLRNIGVGFAGFTRDHNGRMPAMEQVAGINLTQLQGYGNSRNTEKGISAYLGFSDSDDLTTEGPGSTKVGQKTFNTFFYDKLNRCPVIYAKYYTPLVNLGIASNTADNILIVRTNTNSYNYATAQGRQYGFTYQTNLNLGPVRGNYPGNFSPFGGGSAQSITVGRRLSAVFASEFAITFCGGGTWSPWYGGSGSGVAGVQTTDMRWPVFPHRSKLGPYFSDLTDTLNIDDGFCNVLYADGHVGFCSLGLNNPSWSDKQVPINTNHTQPTSAAGLSPASKSAVANSTLGSADTILANRFWFGE